MHQVKTVPFFWIAFYTDGTCLPQFDLNTGKQYSFKEIDQSKLNKFGLYPITRELALKIGGQYYHDPSLPHFVLELKGNQRLIGGIRRETHSDFTFSKCLECGFEWQWMIGREDGSIGDAGLPRYGSPQYSYFIEEKGRKFYEVICPKCGARNNLDCPDCHKPWNKVELEETKDLPVEKKKFRIECLQCKKLRVNKVASTCNGSLTKDIFLLGWQETLPDGTNKKMIMFIFPDGTFQLSDNFNAM